MLLVYSDICKSLLTACGCTVEFERRIAPSTAVEQMGATYEPDQRNRNQNEDRPENLEKSKVVRGSVSVAPLHNSQRRKRPRRQPSTGTGSHYDSRLGRYSCAAQQRPLKCRDSSEWSAVMRLGLVTELLIDTTARSHRTQVHLCDQ